MGQMSVRYAAPKAKKPPSGFTPRVLLFATLLVLALLVLRLMHA